MAKKTITTLEEYNKKYRNLRHRLLKFTKKEVEAFDKKHNGTMSLLKGRKWTLIDGTYYQIPKTLSFTWFRNLHAAAQIGTCVLAAGVVATAVTVPLVMMNKGFDGQVTEDEWKTTINYFSSENDARNFTCNSCMEAYQGKTEGYVKLDKNCEKADYTEFGGSHEITFMKKKSDGSFIKYDKTEESPSWKPEESEPWFYFDGSFFIQNYFIGSADYKSEFKFDDKNHQYVNESTSLYDENIKQTIIIKFSSKTEIKKCEIKVYNKYDETEYNLISLEFSDYGTTTIPDLPSEE